MSFRTILHATDFSRHAEVAFEVVCRLARDAGARPVVLHVAQPPVVIYDERGNFLPPTGDYRETARKRLGELKAPGLEVEHRLEEGEVAATILRVAAEIRADLIVMGTQGRTGLDRLVIGSAAGTVMRQAGCPVVVVRDPGQLSRGGGECPLDEYRHEDSATGIEYQFSKSLGTLARAGPAHATAHARNPYERKSGTGYLPSA